MAPACGAAGREAFRGDRPAVSARCHLGIAGAGAWGRALALAARRAGARVTLWHWRPPARAPLADQGVAVVCDPGPLASCQALLLAVPAAHLEATCRLLAPSLPPGLPACVCSKGIDPGSGRLLPDLAGGALGRAVAVLSGPSFAAEVAAGLPTAVVLAGAPDAMEALSPCLAGEAFRVYRSDDVTGVAVGGAVKNVIAIACGIAAGRGLGENARAALIARGLAETMRLGRALGARPETLMGLAGAGDLVLTCTSARSRNLAFGTGLGRGGGVEALLAASAGVVEGRATAAAVMGLARKLRIDMPISAAVAAVVAGRLGVDEAIRQLLARPAGAEFA